MTDQPTHIWLVTHDFGDGEFANTAWTAEDKARAHVANRKALIAGYSGDEGWEETEDGPAVTWTHEEFDDSVTLTSLNVDEVQS